MRTHARIHAREGLQNPKSGSTFAENKSGRMCCDETNAKSPNVAQQVFNGLNQLLGSPVLPYPAKQARKAICEAKDEQGKFKCSYYDPKLNRCNHCGCFLLEKQALRFEACPTGMWGKGLEVI